MTRTKTFKFQLFTEQEYLTIIRENLTLDGSHLIKYGFPKWNNADIRPFINAVFSSFTVGPEILPSQFLLDTNDSEWIWLVNMSDAMLIRR